MTTTPEQWDDVGSLRLQVDCISNTVQHVQDAVAHLARLQAQESEKREQEKEKCPTKAAMCGLALCGVIMAFVFGFMLALLTFGFPLPISKIANAGFLSEQQSVDHHQNADGSLNNLMNSMKRHENWERLLTPNISIDSQEDAYNNENDTEIGVKVDVNVTNSETSLGLIRMAGTWRKKVKELPQEAPGALEDFPDSLEEDMDEAEGVQQATGEAKNSSGLTQQTVESRGNQSQIDRQAHKVNRLRLRLQSRAAVWVCFPPETYQEKVKRYEGVFVKVARSRRWMVHPFCYLDTRVHDDIYGDHFCGDASQITFVMQKSREEIKVSGKKYAPVKVPNQTKFNECMKYMTRYPESFDYEHPVYHRRTFLPDQDINATLLEEFLYDAYSGKLPTMYPRKRDL
jgi:hypothetical protein